METVMGTNNEKYESLKLGNQLCFPLYACSKEIIRKYKPYLDDIDLTYTQYITMMVLWEKKTVNVKTLGECLYLDSGTLTPVLKKLESKGYITRVRSSEDERNLVVTITEEGEALKDKAISVPASISSCVKLDPEEAALLYKLLYKIIGNVR
jgi:DNA-binding MarR family transcriptional regulator